MKHASAFLLGLLTGLLAAALLVLSTLGQYVSSDLDGFRRFLDGLPTVEGGAA